MMHKTSQIIIENNTLQGEARPGSPCRGLFSGVLYNIIPYIYHISPDQNNGCA